MCFDGGPFVLQKMETADDLPMPDSVDFVGWDQAQDANFVDLSVHEYLMLQHQFLADRWEEGEARIEQMTAEQRAHHRWVLQAYQNDIGIHPTDREQLQAEINATIRNGCRKNLQEIIQGITGHQPNNSLWRSSFA